jgi:hypothetical protein
MMGGRISQWRKIDAITQEMENPRNEKREMVAVSEMARVSEHVPF